MSDELLGRAAAMLPAAATRFVGRRQESREVRRLLEHARLVTLTGVGGVGKTRLALHVAEEARRAFADGVWFVELAVLTSGDRIADAVGTALGITDRSARPALDKLVEHLRTRQVLLVIDNCEHVAADAARVVDRVLRMTTQVRVLATSRHTLGVDGEHVFAVPPLAVPDPRGPHSAAATSRFDAVRLLSDRAAAIDPAFAVTDRNATSVTRLCAQLDGIPLAIELAATRLRTLSVDQVVERLEHRFALLTGGSSAAQPRQRTLRALVDWSHSLCSPAQRVLWARLSVFAGSFDLAAAEAVCADADAGVDLGAAGGLAAGDVLDLLDHLVAQSIVLADRDGGTTVRFRLLETIRQYGREQLAERGEAAALVRRHRDHYIGVVETAAARWCSGHQEADLARLRADHGNLSSALEAATSRRGGGLARGVAAGRGPADAVVRGRLPRRRPALVRRRAGAARRGRRAPRLRAVGRRLGGPAAGRRGHREQPARGVRAARGPAGRRAGRRARDEPAGHGGAVPRRARPGGRALRRGAGPDGAPERPRGARLGPLPAGDHPGAPRRGRGRRRHPEPVDGDQRAARRAALPVLHPVGAGFLRLAPGRHGRSDPAGARGTDDPERVQRLRRGRPHDRDARVDRGVGRRHAARRGPADLRAGGVDGGGHLDRGLRAAAARPPRGRRRGGARRGPANRCRTRRRRRPSRRSSPACSAAHRPPRRAAPGRPWRSPSASCRWPSWSPRG